MRKITFLDHITALLMPFTMTVVIPWFLLQGDFSGSNVHGLQRSAGLLIGVVGIVLFVTTLRLFIVIGKGTLAPWNPTRRFIAVGPYRYCRNPMITGVLSVILGEALFFGSRSLCIWAGCFFAGNTLYFILKEEPDLERKFGQSYRAYKKKVPRWLPSLKPYK